MIVSQYTVIKKSCIANNLNNTSTPISDNWSTVQKYIYKMKYTNNTKTKEQIQAEQYSY